MLLPVWKWRHDRRLVCRQGRLWGGMTRSCHASALILQLTHSTKARSAMPLLSPRGVPYLPDGGVDSPSGLPRQPRRLWVSAMLFLGLFTLLQSGWHAARGTAIERFVIDQATVRTAAWLIESLAPGIGVQATGSRLRAPGGGINILNGCEGTEVFFLLASALLVSPIRWRARLTGLLAGGVLVFVLNQGRVLALFHAYRLDRELFDTLHGLVSPLLLIVATAAFFLIWLNHHAEKPGTDPAT